MKIDMNRLGTIGVLMGGYSSERDISLKSGNAVTQALQKAGCRVKPIDITVQEHDKIISLIRQAQIDVAFIALHGELGEDGVIQGLLEKEKLPYVGSDSESSRSALNKAAAYRIFEKNGIRVPAYRVLRKNAAGELKKIAGELGFPLMIKPADQGSSIGVAPARDLEELEKAFEAAARYSDEVLIEQYINGREFTVGILDEKSLPVIEIRSKSRFFDFQAKYQSGETEYLVPAPIPEDVKNNLQATALKAHHALGCRNFSRIDFMVDEGMNSYLLEVNTIPGFTSTSLLPKAAAAIGIDFTQLCLRLVQLAYEKKK